MTDLISLNTLEILALYRDRKLSPSEYWQAVEARIEASWPPPSSTIRSIHIGKS